VSFNLAPGASLGDVIESINKIADENVPPGGGHDLAGRGEKPSRTAGNTWICCWWRIFVVYIVLGILYESYIHP